MFRQKREDLSFRLTKYPVASSLRPYVKFYYVLEGTDIWLDNHPQGSLDIVFGLNAGLTFQSGAMHSPLLSRIAIVAQQERAFRIGFAPGTRMVGINFKPEGFYKILKLPLSEMMNLSCDISDLLPNSFLEIQEKLLHCSHEIEIIKLLERFLIKQFYKANAQIEPIDKLLRYIRHTNGNIRINEMADKMYVSRRTLHRLFIGRFGIPPKTYTRILRFQNTIRSFYQRSYWGWSGILHDCGYYDQNHFIKDFKQFTGKTPSSFLGDERSLSDFFLKE